MNFLYDFACKLKLFVLFYRNHFESFVPKYCLLHWFNLSFSMNFVRFGRFCKFLSKSEMDSFRTTSYKTSQVTYNVCLRCLTPPMHMLDFRNMNFGSLLGFSEDFFKTISFHWPIEKINKRNSSGFLDVRSNNEFETQFGTDYFSE